LTNNDNTTRRGKIKLVGIVASLAVLALILSPAASSSLLRPQNTASNGDAKLTASSLLNNNLDMIDDTVSDQISDKDLADCGSLNDGVKEILGVTDTDVNNNNNQSNDRKVASDILIGEFCNRPTLIHEIMSTGDKSLHLVAYACDATSGKVGTRAIRDSLSIHKEIYCDSARQVIKNETDGFFDTIKQFRTEYLPLLQTSYQEQYSEDQKDGNSTTNAVTNSSAYNERAIPGDPRYLPQFNNSSNVEKVLDNVTQSLKESKSFLNSENYYDAAKALDNASKTFIALFEKNDGGG
jgi:hypothetical protein